MGSDAQQFRIWLSNDLHAPAEAREHARRVLRDVDATTVDDVALVMSELVTNAMRYGDGPRWATVEPDDDGHIVIEVADCSSRPPISAAPRSSDGGLGLLIVAALSDGFGIDYDDDGKVLRVEIDTDRST